MSGTWLLAVETNQGPASPTVVFQQKGEKLMGTFHNQVFGDVTITGSVQANMIEFGFVGEAGGQRVKVGFKGTVENPTAMKGTAVYEGFDDKATWTGKKK